MTARDDGRVRKKKVDPLEPPHALRNRGSFFCPGGAVIMPPTVKTRDIDVITANSPDVKYRPEIL